MKYKLVCAKNSTELEQLIYNYYLEGWECQGGFHYNHMSTHGYIQAMIIDNEAWERIQPE